jgi:ElaB/YqjD/DUF883 family membrane-anchored ribosome-binding protein
MTAEDPSVADAKRNAQQAQQRLIGTLHELQHRVAPKTLARDAWQGAKSKGADFAEDAVDAVRKRPVAATGIVAALALFLAREPLIDLAGRLVNGKDEPKSRKTSKEKMETT